MNCEYCKNNFKTLSSLRLHQKTAKYCLKIRGEEEKSAFICSDCGKKYTCKENLKLHREKCGFIIQNKKYSEIEQKLKEQKECYEQKLKEQKECYEQELKEQKECYEKKKLKDKISDQGLRIKELQQKIENMAINSGVVESNIINNLEDSDNEIEYSIPPLELNESYVIHYRNEDCYINVIDLCNAGEKKFSEWYSLSESKTFIKLLSSQIGIPEYKIIERKEQTVFVHPKIAINIAQWISLEFGLKVSNWIYELMITGKVITNTVAYKKLQKKNKEQEVTIKNLRKKYNKCQPRQQIKESFVIYILTTPSLEKERRYILGKASNLTTRLTCYNKTDEHKVVYHQSCGDKETMGIVEQTVFYKLRNYRERANRERFILPEGEEIILFISIINETIEHFKNN